MEIKGDYLQKLESPEILGSLCNGLIQWWSFDWQKSVILCKAKKNTFFCPYKIASSSSSSSDDQLRLGDLA